MIDDFIQKINNGIQLNVDLWLVVLSGFRASGTVYTAIDIATGQEVCSDIYSPSYFPLFSFLLQLTACHSQSNDNRTERTPQQLENTDMNVL